MIKVTFGCPGAANCLCSVQAWSISWTNVANKMTAWSERTLGTLLLEGIFAASTSSKTWSISGIKRGEVRLGSARCYWIPLSGAWLWWCHICWDWWKHSFLLMLLAFEFVGGIVSWTPAMLFNVFCVKLCLAIFLTYVWKTIGFFVPVWACQSF